MNSTLFWCGNITLLYHLDDLSYKDSLPITLISEEVSGNSYTYQVKITDKIYSYKFVLSSNTRLIGSFFIEGDHYKSRVYNVDDTYGFVHISETSIDFHDIYMLNKSNMIDVYIRNGKKTSIATVSISENSGIYSVKPTILPITKAATHIPLKGIMYLFAMCGAVSKLKISIKDVIAYTGSTLSFVAYADGPTQIMGVVTHNTESDTDELECLNSFFSQNVQFKHLGDNTYEVTERIDSMVDDTVRRQYQITLKKGRLTISPELAFTYSFENDYLIFRKA